MAPVAEFPPKVWLILQTLLGALGLGNLAAGAEFVKDAVAKWIESRTRLELEAERNIDHGPNIFEKFRLNGQPAWRLHLEFNGGIGSGPRRPTDQFKDFVRWYVRYSNLTHLTLRQNTMWVGDSNGFHHIFWDLTVVSIREDRMYQNLTVLGCLPEDGYLNLLRRCSGRLHIDRIHKLWDKDHPRAIFHFKELRVEEVSAWGSFDRVEGFYENLFFNMPNVRTLRINATWTKTWRVSRVMKRARKIAPAFLEAFFWMRDQPRSLEFYVLKNAQTLPVLEDAIDSWFIEFQGEWDIEIRRGEGSIEVKKENNLRVSLFSVDSIPY
jgi:hypothetical protein